MNGHLLAISIGPVQEFIAAARRTRDLWFGSHVLSEISKAAAKALADKFGLEALIFPSPQTAEELLPVDSESRYAVANIILARLPSGNVPAEVAAVAKQAAEKRWRMLAEDAKERACQVHAIREDVWLEQVDDVVEFYSAWAALASLEKYRETRKLVMRLLAGRKACRNFLMSTGRPKLPKSSLDGARETVLFENTIGSGRLPLADGEQLDVIGLTKRLAGGGQSYPSVARVAADPWLRTLADSTSHAVIFGTLRKECGRLNDKQILSRSEMPSDTFLFDGTAVFIHRHADLVKETGQTKAEIEPLSKIITELTRSIATGGLGEPNPYLAVLVADGDRMGSAIAEIATIEGHQEFSRKLSRFALQAKELVKKANGICVYAGGDDVLAFVPLDNCLECARSMKAEFESLMGTGKWKTSEGKIPTLSVGIAIGHFMEPLEDLLSFGREAEQAAKKSTELGGEDVRNALAVVVRTRGAAPISVRDNWRPCDDEAALDRRLLQWAELFANGSLPNKLAYELSQLVRLYKQWPTATLLQRDALQNALSKDVGRLLKRKQVNPMDDERADDADAKRRDRRFIKSRIDSITSVSALKSLAEELLISQQIGVVLQQSFESRRMQLQEAIQ